MKKGWPGHWGNLSLSAICRVCLWQCLLIRQEPGEMSEMTEMEL